MICLLFDSYSCFGNRWQLPDLIAPNDGLAGRGTETYVERLMYLALLSYSKHVLNG